MRYASPNYITRKKGEEEEEEEEEPIGSKRDQFVIQSSQRFPSRQDWRISTVQSLFRSPLMALTSDAMCFQPHWPEEAEVEVRTGLRLGGGLDRAPEERGRLSIELGRDTGYGLVEVRAGLGLGGGLYRTPEERSRLSIELDGPSCPELTVFYDGLGFSENGPIVTLG
ncbi:hypothetical protein CRG98_000113 [Punica granatum]|uniref:Uncharacterized protein n=1 Tax=Punica granatum TaxID=22663 RepID=A0A2I0LFM0_PUNGR|nr:hypothetical protein CRG98_000113 [Punica granatum]